jgi:hypothetical protein
MSERIQAEPVQKPELYIGNQNTIELMLETAEKKLRLDSLHPIIRVLGSYDEMIMSELTKSGVNHAEFWQDRTLVPENQRLKPFLKEKDRYALQLRQVHEYAYDNQGNLVVWKQDIRDAWRRLKLEKRFRVEDRPFAGIIKEDYYLICDIFEDGRENLSSSVSFNMFGDSLFLNYDGRNDTISNLSQTSPYFAEFRHEGPLKGQWETRKISVSKRGYRNTNRRVYHGYIEGYSTTNVYDSETMVERNDQNQVYRASFPSYYDLYEAMSFDIKRDENGRIVEIGGRYVKNGLTDDIASKTTFNYSGNECIVYTQLGYSNLPENWNVLGGVY